MVLARTCPPTTPILQQYRHFLYLEPSLLVTMVRQELSAVLFREVLNDLELISDCLIHRSRSVNAWVEFLKSPEYPFTYHRVTCDGLSC